MAAGVLLAAAPLTASAQPLPDKQACIDAHGKGQELRNAKRLLEAKASLLVCNDAACPGVVRRDCADLLAEVTSSIPTASITVVSGPDAITDAIVEVDSAPWTQMGVARELEPGPHEVVVVHPKLGRVTRKFTAVEGSKNQSVTIELKAPSAPGPAAAGSSAAPPIGAVVLLGSAIAVLGVGLGFEGWAVSSKDGVETACVGLDQARCDELDTTKDWRTKHLVANISYGVAGAALASGVIWWIVDATMPAEVKTALPVVTIDPLGRGAFAGVSGSF